MRNNVGRALCALVCAMSMAAAATAQSPVRFTHGDDLPPTGCVNVPKSTHRMSVEEAEKEIQRGLLDTHAIPSDEPMENFALDRYRLADYDDCIGSGGCYWADLDAQYKRAEGALRLEVAQHKGEKLAVVMDIDETSLSAYCEMKREDYGFISSMFNTWVITPDASVAIPGALRFFNEAKALGVSVFFITGRPGIPAADAVHPIPDQTAATERNLRAAGYEGWAGLALRNGPENHMSTIAYKSSERKKIIARGYTILLSIGDQWSDIEGAPQAEVGVKLPNPFYFLP